MEAVTDLASGFGFLAHLHAGHDDAQFRLPNVSLGRQGARFLLRGAVQPGPGTHVLTQSFTVAPASTMSLGYDLFINDFEGRPIINIIGIDHTGPANQHTRIDILTAAASPFNTGAGVFGTFFLGVDPQGSKPNPFTANLFDLLAIVSAGGTFQIRIGEVDNQDSLIAGLDNVSVLAGTGVPEPATPALFGLGLGGHGLAQRHKQKVALNTPKYLQVV